MQTQQIRRMIREAVAIEKDNGILTNALQVFAMSRGIQPSSEQLENTRKFIEEYVEHAPALLDAIDSAARQAGIIDQVKSILEAAEGYFFAPVDIIPDHLGLVGLMDDAYLIHCLIQALSNSYRDRSGNTLLQLDMTQANQFIRSLIGEPQASMLDAGVANVLNAPAIQQSLQSLLSSDSGFNMADTDPMWGNASMDEIVTARLGAMGVV